MEMVPPIPATNFKGIEVAFYTFLPNFPLPKSPKPLKKSIQTPRYPVLREIFDGESYKLQCMFFVSQLSLFYESIYKYPTPSSSSSTAFFAESIMTGHRKSRPFPCLQIHEHHPVSTAVSQPKLIRFKIGSYSMLYFFSIK